MKLLAGSIRFIGHSIRQVQHPVAWRSGTWDISDLRQREGWDGQEEVASREALSQCCDPVGQIDGFLVDLKILEHERHAQPQRPEQENR